MNSWQEITDKAQVLDYYVEQYSRHGIHPTRPYSLFHRLTDTRPANQPV